MPSRSPRKPTQQPRGRRESASVQAEIARLKARVDDAEQRLRDLLEGSLQGVMVNLDNRLKFVNAAFAAIFGYPSVQAVLEVEDWQRFQAPHERERMEGYRSARLRGDYAPTRYVFEGRKRDGSPVWVENIARVITWDGRPAVLGTMVDISDRRRMEEELRQSEARFRVAFERAPMGVSVSVPGRGWIQVNDEYCKFLGRSREELLNHPAPMELVREASHPEDFEPDARMFAQLTAGAIDTYQMEKRYFRPNGELRWGQLAVSATRDAAGAIQYVIAHVVDITARKQAETAARQSEERFRVAFEHAPVGMNLVNSKGQYVQVNQAFAEFVGIPRQALLALPSIEEGIVAVTHPDDVEASRVSFRKLLSGELDGCQLEKRYLRPDGEVRWGVVNLAPVRTPEGALDYVITQVVDITDRKQAEEALRKSEERFRVAFEQGSIGISLIQAEHGYLHANQAFSDFVGYPREQLETMTSYEQVVRAVTHPDDVEATRAGFKKLIAGELDRFQQEKRYLRPDGTVRWGVVNSTLVRTPEGTPDYLINQIVDITDRKLAETALRESEERFRVAFEYAPVGLALAEFGAGGVQVNPAMCTFLARPAEAFTTNRDRMALIQLVGHPDDLAEDLASFTKLRKGEISSYQMEKRYRRPSGEVRWGHLSVTATRSPEGRLRYVIAQITDVTERKIAEEALRESEERFRIAFEHAPMGIALGIVGQGWIQVNPALVAFLGRTREELLALKDPITLIRTITHPDDVRSSLDHLRQLSEREVDSYLHEKRYLRPDGEVRWGRHSVAGSVGPDGKLRYTISLVSDVTALRQAEEALRESEERFRIAFEHAPLGISVAVPGRGWVQVNQAMEHFLGRPREVLLGRHDVLALIKEISHPDDFGRNEVMFRRMMDGEIDAYQMEKRYIRPSGEVRWGFLNVAASRGPDGAVRYTVSQIADITALKQTEQALREREASLAAAQSITHLGSWELDLADVKDLDRNPLRWSDEVFRIFGHEPGAIEVSNENFFAHVHPDDRARIRQAVEHAIERHGQYSIEHRVVRPDGKERIVREQSEILYDPSTGKPLRMRGTVQDVTEQKDLETKLLQSQKLESLGLLAGGIAHDFNNLLTGILGYASLSQQALPPGSPLGEYLGQIEAGGRRAAELCQQMLAYAGRGRFDVRRHNINAIVRDTLPLLEVSISKKVTLLLHLAEQLPTVEVDGSQIRQIVMNLVTNAADAIGNAAGRISITSGVMAADRAYLAQTYLAPDLPEGTYVFLEVSDTGAGMAPDVIEKIFDPFFTTKFAGRGLGLAAVLGIVRAHRGALKVYSEPGHGSTLRLLLPAAGGPLSPESPAATPEWRGRGLALVIDDEATVRNVAARLLEALGFTVLAAADGREGVATFRAQAQQVGLVLLDLTMPHMDGEEAFHALRQIDPAVKVVLMSGFTEQEALDRFAGTGLAAFLQKPFTLASLRETLQRVFTPARQAALGP